MAVDYEVGNILINIETKATQLDKALSTTITSLKALKKSIAGISNLNLDKVQSNLKTISTLNFNGLENAFKPLANIDTKALSSFNRQMRNIANLNFDNVDFAKLSTQVTALTLIIDPFIQKIVKAEPSLKAFSNALDLGKVNAQLMVAEARVNAINSKAQSRKVLDDKKIEKANTQLEIAKKRLDDINSKSKKTKKSFSKIFDIGKMYLILNYMRRWGNTLGKIVTSAINFNETLNKFQVSMGGNYERSLEFVDSITKAFNLSTESVMNYMSTFKNMLSALGNLSENTSYELSETLTRMALDYASLFNVTTERAMEQFQAVLSGQIRSIRSVSGYDVSETSLFSLYQSLGGTKTMRQLDQIEKRLLRIIALQQQMEETGAVGDFEKTINTTSNQLKQLQETFKEIGRWLGQLTMHYIQPFVEKLLAGAIALRELLKAINIANGYQYEEFGEGGLFGEIKDSASNAEEAIDSLKRNLLGFDKLNVLGSSTGTGDTNYSFLLDQIKKYSSSLDEVTNKANEMSIKILEWLGYTYNANGELEKTGERLSDILSTISAIFTTIVSFALMKKIRELIPIITAFVAKFKEIGGLKGVLGGVTSKLGIIGIIITAIVAGFTYMYNGSEKFKESVDKTFASIKESFSGIVNRFSELGATLKPILDVIMTILGYIGKNVLEDINEIFNGIESLVNGNALGFFNSILQSLLNFPKAITGIIDELFGTNVTGWLEEKLFNGEWWKNNFAKLGEWFSGIFDTVGLALTVFWERLKMGFKDSLKAVGNFFIDVLNGIIIGFENFLNFFVRTINGITSTMSKAWTWAGIPAIGQIPLVEFEKIPALASGGVITQPTTALVGEYAGARTNPEIVTPENLMREVFIESMLPIAQAIVSGDREVVNAIQDLANRPVELNGRKVSENIYNDLQKVAMRKGHTMFASAR